MKKSKNIVTTILKFIGILLIIFLIFVAGKIIIFRQKAVTHITVKDNVVQKKTSLGSSKTATKQFKLNPEKVSNITIYYNGKKIDFNNDIYKSNLRYYVNLDNLKKQMNLDINQTAQNEFKLGSTIINIKNNTFSQNNKTYDLRGKSFVLNDKQYISINDIANILNLRSHWDIENNSIYLFKDKKEITAPKEDTSNSPKKAALIRFEDVSAGDGKNSNGSFEKIRILGDYLYSTNTKFNVTWIPRYKKPKENIDNNLLTNDTFSNFEFINTLDHLIFRGGTIGLHGYTHQSGDTVSAVGSEMTWKINTKESDVRSIAENALNTASLLNIPVDFFESPHYHAVRKQQKILEEYFKIMYEPYSGYWNFNPIKTDKSLYVPTPLDYVKDDHGEAIAKSIMKKSDFALSSVFVHPYKELQYIKLGSLDNNGYVDYTYEDNTPVKNIVDAFKKTNHQTISVSELVK